MTSEPEPPAPKPKKKKDASSLPYTLQEEFTQELAAYEEAKVMPYITSFERRGMEKGIEQGIEQGRLIERESAEAEKQKLVSQAAMKMLLKGLPAEDVADFFDLSVEEVQAIKQQNQH